MDDVVFKMHNVCEEQRLVSGWANISLMADGSIPLDWQGDVIPPSVLEEAAINFMLEYRDSGVMHTGGSVGTIVESIVFTAEKQRAIGIPEGLVPQGWFITVKVHDADVFERIKQGVYRMFSIQGICQRTVL
jgi:hypothetical protein